MSLWEILTPIKKYKAHLKIKCFTDLGNVFTYRLDVLSLYSSLLKFHLLSWLARWCPNHASHPKQVPTPHFHLSGRQANLNIPPSSQAQHVWNTLIFYLHLKSFTLLLSLSQFLCIHQSCFVLWKRSLLHLYFYFHFLAQILLPTKLVFSLLWISLGLLKKLWPLHFFLQSPPTETPGHYHPNPNSTHSSR